MLSEPSSTSAWPAACASRAPARRKSTPCWRCGRSAWATSPKLLAAVRAFAALPEAPALAAANKRIGNILKKSAKADAHVSEVLLQEAAEKSLYARCAASCPQADAQFDAGDYTGSLQTLAALRATVDAFFDGVMVNAEEADLRLNRLGLLCYAARRR